MCNLTVLSRIVKYCHFSGEGRLIVVINDIFVQCRHSLLLAQSSDMNRTSQKKKKKKGMETFLQSTLQHRMELFLLYKQVPFFILRRAMIASRF